MTFAQTDAASLEATLKGKRMALRNYSADPNASYTLQKDVLVADEAKARALSLFTTRSVSLKNNQLLLRGERTTLVQDVSKRLLGVNGNDEMTLRVDLRDAEPASILPKISSLLFFSDADTAVNSLPEQVKDFLPYDISHTRRVGTQWINDGGQWRPIAAKDPKYTYPTPVSMPDPKFTDEALRDKTNGFVVIVFEITDAGQVKDFWLGNSLKSGLSEQALLAARKYRFKPARYGGKAIGSELLTQVNFQVK